MSDLISRDKAVEVVNKIACGSFDGDLSYLASEIEDALLDLPSAEPQWNPISEKRLPEEDGMYIVTTSKGYVQVHVFNLNGNSEEYWKRCNKAWMPLPEPYKGEQP